jgi:hypothetical protein
MSGPMRAVVKVLASGAGSDLLLLECGHQISVNHSTRHPARKRCHRCRVTSIPNYDDEREKAALEIRVDRLETALRDIREATARRSLPLTDHIWRRADAALEGRE